MKLLMCCSMAMISSYPGKNQDTVFKWFLCVNALNHINIDATVLRNTVHLSKDRNIFIFESFRSNIYLAL